MLEDLQRGVNALVALSARAGVTNAFDRSMGNEWPGFTSREEYVGLSWVVAPVGLSTGTIAAPVKALASISLRR